MNNEIQLMLCTIRHSLHVRISTPSRRFIRSPTPSASITVHGFSPLSHLSSSYALPFFCFTSYLTMFTLLPYLLLGASLAIAAPAPLGMLKGLESRSKTKTKISLFKDALPEADPISPFIILGDIPPTTAHIEETRSLPTPDGPEVSLLEPPESESTDETTGWIGTDIGPLEATQFNDKRCLEGGTDIEPLGGGIVLKAKRHLPGEAENDCGGIQTDDGPIDVFGLKAKRGLPGGRGSKPSGAHQQGPRPGNGGSIGGMFGGAEERLI
ncbi:hypothetical protein PENSPDRAFT_470816 [Peniophora sp. CONT]|nr:hypothetical protein PENSPDRAFT_470816 [Peniophora sp. CONT]